MSQIDQFLISSTVVSKGKPTMITIGFLSILPYHYGLNGEKYFNVLRGLEAAKKMIERTRKGKILF